MDATTVRAIRIRLEKSQREFADLVGVSESTIQMVESGNRPLTRNLWTLISQKVDVDDPDMKEAIRRVKAAERLSF